MNKLIVDSSAWIEYLSGSSRGKKVSERMHAAETRVFIIGPTIAEVLVKYLREKQDATDAIAAMHAIPMLVPVDLAACEQAANIYFEQRQKKPKFGLIDAITVSAGKAVAATLITCDFDFSGLPNVVIIQ